MRVERGRPAPAPFRQDRQGIILLKGAGASRPRSGMQKITLDEVEAVRARFAQARDDAARRFRESFANAAAEIPPNERWRTHLEIQAVSMLEKMAGVRLKPGYEIGYVIDEERRMVAPVAAAAGSALPTDLPVDHFRAEDFLFPFFTIDRTGEALLEYWMLTSDLLSSTEWKMTKLIARPGEHDALLASMDHPQILNALFASYLPEAEFQPDGTAFLDVTVYSRAGQERIERRRLFLDTRNELHFHSRQIVAEGEGGVG